MQKNHDWYYPTATSFSALSQSSLCPQLCMNIHHSQTYFVAQPLFTWKQTLPFAEACPVPLCRFTRAQMHDLQKKVWDIYSFVLAHLTTLLSKFSPKPQVKEKAFLNICGSLSYPCPQTIRPLRYPKAVTVFKKSASPETESFSKQSGRLTDFILSASILWFYLLILISLRPPIS